MIKKNYSYKKIKLNQSVWDAGLERMRWVFSEFDNVIVSFSGGKDSTVVYHLALKVAEELGRLPLKVCFVDQEGEYLAAIEEVKKIMYDPKVEPYWYQCHIQINNANSTDQNYLQVWGPGEEWMREKDPISIKETPPGAEDWYNVFPSLMKSIFGKEKACMIGGLRGEESPNRFKGLTSQATYKWVTWGKILDKSCDHYTFYPIWDWHYWDVWKAIHENNWSYCSIYDVQYQYGVKVPNMRVSCLYHETAIHSLFYLQEAEPENYVALCKRLKGIDTTGKMGALDSVCPKTLPPMFKDWKEYRDYLLVNLWKDETNIENMKKKFAYLDEKFEWCLGEGLTRKQINSILTNDFGGWKLNNINVPIHLVDEQKRRNNERKLKNKEAKDGRE